MSGFESSWSWAKISLPFVLLATTSHSIGLWTSSWYVSHHGDFVVRYGLWKSCPFEPSTTLCGDIDLSSLSVTKQNALVRVRWTLLVALICLLVALVMSPFYICIEGTRKERRKGIDKLKYSRDAISLLTFFLTPVYVITEAVRNKFIAVVLCCLCFIAAGSIGFGVIIYRAEFEISLECWSLVITLVGGVSAGAAGILFFKDAWGETY